MALLNPLRTASYRNIRILLCACRHGILKSLLRNKSFYIEVDDGVLDGFTTQLIQKKSGNWGSLSVNGILPAELKDTTSEKSTISNIKHLNTKEINVLFQDALDIYDVNKLTLLVKECTELKIYPSVTIIVNTLSSFSQQGNIEGIKDIKLLCEDIYPDFVSMNSQFDHYLAEAIWMKGNITKAIELFDTVYKTNAFLRRRIRLTLRYLISETVMNRSEAVMISIVMFCENLYKHYKDYYLLLCVWQVCFLSDWYTDQCLALKLMDKNIAFCKIAMNQIPFTVSASLKNHKTEPVYKLLEILLKYDFKMQSSIVLIALFDYSYRQGDLVRCMEIYSWSMKYNMAMPTIQHGKLLKLLLNQDANTMKKKPSATVTADYRLKF